MIIAIYARVSTCKAEGRRSRVSRTNILLVLNSC